MGGFDYFFGSWMLLLFLATHGSPPPRSPRLCLLSSISLPYDRRCHLFNARSIDCSSVAVKTTCLTVLPFPPFLARSVLVPPTLDSTYKYPCLALPKGRQPWPISLSLFYLVFVCLLNLCPTDFRYTEPTTLHPMTRASSPWPLLAYRFTE